MNILYVGNFHDGTGYSRACSETAVALDASGANVVCRPITFNEGKQRCHEKIYELSSKPLPNSIDAVIQHTLPSAMAYDSRVGLNVASFYYETSHFRSSGWAVRLNQMDLVLTTPGVSADSCLASGVIKPVVGVPLSSDPHRYMASYPVPTWMEKHKKNKKFIFYTIGENIRRKNLGGLIKAYLFAFKNTDHVVLMIKTSGDTKRLHDIITHIAEGMKFTRHPEIVIISDRLSDSDLMGLHQHSDCFVQASCGEAWSYPAFDALGMGKTPIVPDTGTYRSYIDDTTGYPVRTYVEPCSGGSGEITGLYRGDETWEVPYTLDLAQAMQRAYQEDKQRETMSLRGLDTAYQFTPARIGKILLEAITNATQKEVMAGLC